MKLSIKDYMESRNISRRTIYNRIQAGLLETIKEKNKTYIIKENDIKTENKKCINNFDLSVLNELKQLAAQFSLIQSSYDLLKEFDYNFLRERLSTIESSTINFSLSLEKKVDFTNTKLDNFLPEILKKFDLLQEKNDNFLQNILLINEQNQNFFKQNIESLNEKFDILLNKFETMEEKFDEIIKSSDVKKTFNIFKK